MRKFALLALILVVASSMLFAGTDRPIPHKEKSVTLYSDVKVAGKVLPKGEYDVRHVSDGQDNILVFSQGKKEYRFKCQLQPTADKTNGVALQMKTDPDGTRTLVSVTFPGDASAHVF